jgi:hypothetical protein
MNKVGKNKFLTDSKNLPLLAIIILIIFIGLFCYIQTYKNILHSNKYFCNKDEDCEIQAIECKECCPMVGCVNSKWIMNCNYIENEPICKPCSPFWVNNCKCINSKCVDCRGEECKTD